MAEEEKKPRRVISWSPYVTVPDDDEAPQPEPEPEPQEDETAE